MDTWGEIWIIIANCALRFALVSSFAQNAAFAIKLLLCRLTAYERATGDLGKMIGKNPLDNRRLISSVCLILLSSGLL